MAKRAKLDEEPAPRKRPEVFSFRVGAARGKVFTIRVWHSNLSDALIIQCETGRLVIEPHTSDSFQLYARSFLDEDRRI